MCVAVKFSKQQIKSQTNDQKICQTSHKNSKKKNKKNNKDFMLHVNNCKFLKKNQSFKSSIRSFKIKKKISNLNLKLNNQLKTLLSLRSTTINNIINENKLFIYVQLLLHQIFNLIKVNFFLKFFLKFNLISNENTNYGNKFMKNWHQSYMLPILILYIIQLPSNIKADKLSSFYSYSSSNPLLTNSFTPVFSIQKFSYLLTKNNKSVTKKSSSTYFSPDSSFSSTSSYLLHYTTTSTNHLYNQNTSAHNRSNAFLLNYTSNFLNKPYVKVTSLHKKTSQTKAHTTKANLTTSKIVDLINENSNSKLNLSKLPLSYNKNSFNQPLFIKNELTLTSKILNKQNSNFQKNNFQEKKYSPQYAFLVLSNQLNSSFEENFINNTNYNLSKIILLDSLEIQNKSFFQTITNITWWTHVPYPKSGYSQLSIVLLAFLITIIMILIVVGNLLVCIAICTEKSLKTIQNWFIASLAVSDLLLGLIIMPFSLAYELMGYWIFGSFWCEMHHALDVLLTTASINNLCLISLDRYWSVTQAIEYLKKRTPCRAIFMIAFAWVFSAVVCLPPLVGWKKENQKLDECELSDDFGYVLYSSLGSFYIPAVVMVFVYAKIFLAARSRARKHVRIKQAAINVSNEINNQNKSQTYIKSSKIQMINNFNTKNTNEIKLTRTESNISLEAPSSSPQINNQKALQLSSNSSEANMLKLNKIGFRVPFGRFACKTQTDVGLDLDDENLTIQHEKQVTNNENQNIKKIESNQEPNNNQTNSISNEIEPEILTQDNKERIKTDSKTSTPTSKVTFSPKEIVFNCTKNNEFQTLLPQIVIHGSMQHLHLQGEIKRTSRFASSTLYNTKSKENYSSNTLVNQFTKNKHPKITNTLSAGHLSFEILNTENSKSNYKCEQSSLKKFSSMKHAKTSDKKGVENSNKLQKSNLITSTSLTLTSKNEDKISPLNGSLVINETEKIELKEKNYSLINDKENNFQVLNLNQNSSLFLNTTENESNIQRKKLSDLEQVNKNYLAINSFQYVASLSDSMLSINCDDNLNYLEKKRSRKIFQQVGDPYEYDLDEENESSFEDELCRKHNRTKKNKYKSLLKWFFCRRWKIINENCLNNEEEYDGYEEEDEEYDDLDELEYDEQSGCTEEHFCQSRKHLNSKNKNDDLKKKKRAKRKPGSSIASNNNTSSSGNYSGSFRQISFTTNDKKKYKRSSLFSRFSSSRNNSNKISSSSSRKCTTSAPSSNDKSKDKILITPISAISSSLTFKHSKNNRKQHSKQENYQNSQRNSKTEYRFQANEADRQKRKIAKAREKRATLILGLIMGSFIAGWIPFFGLYLLQGICAQCKVQSALSFGYWLGYCNSAINPIIYTVFNRDFRKAFRKILFR